MTAEHLSAQLKLAWEDVVVLFDAVGTVCVLSIMISIDEDVGHLGMAKRDVILTEFLRVAGFRVRGPEVLAWSHDVVVICLVEGFVAKISAIGDATVSRFGGELATESTG